MSAQHGRMVADYDLFTYPTFPGFKRSGTSQEAAASIDAHTLRAKVLDLMTPALAVTADEAAGLLGISILSIRPRFTELSQRGKIVDTGKRRKNASGRSAIVWQVAP